ncbi:MAG: hypothetical protein L6V86_01000 [Treponema sp.]|nr:MAG: hypothetical protein L6V86_01000 [Treponema sp.]
MAKKSAMSIGSLLLQIALGVMLAVAGIWALAGKGGDDAYKAVRGLINGDAGNIIAMVCSSRIACRNSSCCRMFCR